MDLKILNGYVLGLIGLFSICLYILVIAALLHDLMSRRPKAGTQSADVRLGPGGQGDQEVSNAIDLENRRSNR